MKRLFLLVPALLLPVFLTVPASGATPVHWASMNVTVIDSLKPEWDAARNAAISGWNLSVMNLSIESGSTSRRTRLKCPAVMGKIRMCNYRYAKPWAGLAKIWWDGNGHIVQGWAKLNTRFAKSDHKMRTVACHELGHTLGLNHNNSSDSCLTPVIGTSSVPSAQDILDVNALYAHIHKTASTATATDGRDGPYRTRTFEFLP